MPMSRFNPPPGISNHMGEAAPSMGPLSGVGGNADVAGLLGQARMMPMGAGGPGEEQLPMMSLGGNGPAPVEDMGGGMPGAASPALANLMRQGFGQGGMGGMGGGQDPRRQILARMLMGARGRGQRS